MLFLDKLPPSGPRAVAIWPTVQRQEDVKTKPVERLEWRLARRDDPRGARRLWQKQGVAIYRLDEGASLGAFVHFLEGVGELTLMRPVRGEATQREMVAFAQYVLRYGLKRCRRCCSARRSRSGRGSRLPAPSARMPWRTTL